jgi:hypothetical protein
MCGSAGIRHGGLRAAWPPGRAYPKLIYFNELDRGDHFAAWQEPALFSVELRTAFRSLR